MPLSNTDCINGFDLVPEPYIILSPDLHIQMANKAYLAATFLQAHQLHGKSFYEIFPEGPENMNVNHHHMIRNFIERIMSSRKPHVLTLQQHALAAQPYSGSLENKDWNIVTTPVLDDQGKVIHLVMKFNEIPQFHQNLQSPDEAADKERQLRLLTNALPVLISYLDKDEVYRFVNKAYEEWFPFKSEEIEGRPVRQVIGEVAYSRVKQYIDMALAGEIVNFEAKMPYRENFIKHIQTSYVPDFKEGEVAGFYALITDISKQAEIREQLGEREEKYRSLFENMDQAFCIIEPIYNAANKGIDFRYLEVNPKFQDITHWNDPVGKTGRELVPNIKDKWAEIYGKVALTGKAARFTERPQSVDRWYEVHAYRIGKEESRKVAVLFTDVSDRIQAEESLQRTNSWFELVNQATQDTIWDWNLATNSIQWNEKVLSMFHYLSKDVRNEASWWYEKIHPADRDWVVKNIHEVIDSGKIQWTAEYRFLTGNGDYKVVFDRGFVLHDTNGMPVRMIGSMQDISKRKKAEEILKEKNEQLLKTNNDLDNFIYTASHDLKAPILNIEGLVNILNNLYKKGSLDKEKTAGILGMIDQSIDRFKATINDLVEVAKVQSNTEHELVSVSFDAIVEEINSNIHSLIQETDARVHVDFSRLPNIQFSKKNLRSILYNLVSNAIKYRSPLRKPAVSITTSRINENTVLLAVQDNGLGIRKKDIPKVFMMFTRLHGHVEGTGIGMAIVKRIVDNNGGRIEIESEEGKGSLFKIYLKA